LFINYTYIRLSTPRHPRSYRRETERGADKTRQVIKGQIELLCTSEVQ